MTNTPILRLALCLAGLTAACGSVSAHDQADASSPDAFVDPTQPIIIATGQNAPTGIAVDDTGVYFADRGAGTIVRCPRSGCGAEPPEVIVSEQAGLLSVAVDEGYLYWVTGWHDGESGDPPSRPVYKCPLDNCGPGTITAFDTGTVQPYELRAVGQDVYLSAWPTLAACSTADCAQSTTLFQAPVVSTAVDAETLFVSLYGAGELDRCALPGCTNRQPFLTDVRATSIVVDDTNVYFSDYDVLGFGPSTSSNGIPRILTCPRTGCDAGGPTVMVSTDVTPYGLALYGDRLYYTNLEQGTVVSIPKTTTAN